MNTTIKKILFFIGMISFSVFFFSISEVNAAEIEITMVDYMCGLLCIEDPNNILEETENGKVLYYQTASNEGNIKDGKYSIITNTNSSNYTLHEYWYHEEGNYYYYDISDLIGKEIYLSISPDGKKETSIGIKLVAAPKVSAKYSVKDKNIIFAGDIVGSIVSPRASSVIVRCKMGKYGDYDDIFCANDLGEDDTDTSFLEEAIKMAQALGSTLYIKVAKIETLFIEDEYITMRVITPFSDEIKIKIPARAKEPKNGIKLDLKKAFAWKISKTLEYKIENKSIVSKKWTEGSGNADNWHEIIKKAAGEEIASKIVTGDAIMEDVTLKLRTSETDKKIASNINIITLKKSVNSPTTAAIEIKVTPETEKKTGTVSITAKEKIQYSIDEGLTWTILEENKNKVIKESMLKKGIYVRYPGNTENLLLPSLVTKYIIDDSTIMEEFFEYDELGKVKGLYQKIN